MPLGPLPGLGQSELTLHPHTIWQCDRLTLVEERGRQTVHHLVAGRLLFDDEAHQWMSPEQALQNGKLACTSKGERRRRLVRVSGDAASPQFATN